MPTLVELRDKAQKSLTAAQVYITDGNAEAAQKAVAEAKSIRDQIQSITDSENQLKTLKGDYTEPVSGLPSSVEEIKNFNPNDDMRHRKSSYKPANWVKGYGPAVQPKWVRDQMGDDEKAEARFYRDQWFKWFTDRTRDAQKFWREADSKAIKAMQENTDNEGGYYVPEEFRTITIHDTGLPGGVIRPYCTQLNTGLKDGYMPTIGSVTWAAIAEEAAYGDNTPTAGQVTYTIRKSGGAVKVSAELLEDEQVNLPGLLAQIFGEAAGRWEDTQVIGGDGTTEPEGLRTASITDVLAAGDDVLVLGDFFGWYYGLPAQFRGNLTWFTSSGVMADATALQVTSNKGDLAASPDTQILGRPVALFDDTGWDDAATLAVNEEIGAVGDFRNYYLIDRIGMSLKRDDSIYVANDQVGFFARKRGDGVVGLTNAFRIMKMFSS